MAEEFVNKVAKSGLVTLDLETFHNGIEIAPFDLKNFLFMEMVLKEKDFRNDLEQHNWAQYQGKILAVFCSVDAIIASWAYMLVASHAREHTVDVLFGTPEQARYECYRRNLETHDWAQYDGKRVLLKGCSDKELPQSVYLLATQHLLPFAERLMYGEACSFVPVYRKPKQAVSHD